MKFVNVIGDEIQVFAGVNKDEMKINADENAKN